MARSFHIYWLLICLLASSWILSSHAHEDEHDGAAEDCEICIILLNVSDVAIDTSPSVQSAELGKKLVHIPSTYFVSYAHTSNARSPPITHL